ncbi:MAG: class I SAM-dependent methyltransferase [Acidobacteria bacterium]|nr:class I SAM-dependent methyltransferase [Acidobacteriota bacterium]
MSDERFIEQPPAGLEGWRAVWRDDRRYPPRPGLVARLLRKLAAILLRASGEPVRQRDFNLAILELITDLRTDLKGVETNLARDLQAHVARMEELVPIAVRRGDALVAAVDRKIEGVSARLRDLANPPAGEPVAIAARADFVYRRLEEALRGSEADVREAARHYLPYLKEGAPVVDIGCGRGELLSLCRDEAIAAKGFDTNERSVADLLAKGLDASVGAIPGCLNGFENGSIGTLVAMHVVEHLPAGMLFALYTEAARVIRAGGHFVIETPNAASVVVSATELWKDPTHLGPRHLASLVTLGREAGFDVAEATTGAPFPESDTIQVASDASREIRQLVTCLNQILYGDQNLRVVLRRR